MDEEVTRLYLQTKLEEAFSGVGVYFRPPGDERLSRPCIIYEPKNANPSYANNTPYVIGTEFQVILLSDIPGDARKWDMFDLSGVIIRSNNTYVSNDVVHDVFTITVNSI